MTTYNPYTFPSLIRQDVPKSLQGLYAASKPFRELYETTQRIKREQDENRLAMGNPTVAS